MTATERATSSPGHVLVVEDDASARGALVEMLRAEGFIVRAAADGFKALGHLDDWTPDLLVSDVMMPGLDGVELMRRLILKTLEHVRGSTSKAAEMLGISARTIQYRLSQYRGDAPEASDDADRS